ncbi:MAG: hypothetical protein E7099_04515 [Mediterranea massiliensis]|nr:hypothetical protein [Mediterranea massiliensis]
MKNIKILSMALCGLLAFTACEDDNDSNPIVQQPTTFQLNTPALASNVYDLEQTNSITLTCQQPDYGYTAPVNYYAQMSLSGQWNPATSVEANDATFVELDGSTTNCEYTLDITAVNRNIMMLGHYEKEADVPQDGVTVYVRLRATLASGYECFSNVIELKMQPYYVALVSADPELWYLIGGCIGDGTWGSELGKSVFPLCPVEGGVYDAVTGQGPLTYTGYFPSDKGFKIVKTPGQWADQWGARDGNWQDPYKKDADGEGSDFYVPTSGYYTINLDTKNDVLTITEAETPKEYDHLFISGDFNGWATDVQMNPVTTVAGVKNNVWYYDLDASAGNTTAKFLYDGWSPNWGATAFPYGWGTNGGANIPVEAGKYRIIFNHVEGYYHFFPL